MDFSKAFDEVDHHKLVNKLKHMGVNPYITTRINDFLHNRSQQVLVEHKVSHSLPVLSGVTQDSVVGSSFFIAYINDVPGSVRSRVRLFANDTIVYLTIKSHASAQSLWEDLHNLELWEKEWSMEFNPDKFLEYTEKRNQLSSHTHFMTPPSEPQKTQNISGSLSVVTSIGHLI